MTRYVASQWNRELLLLSLLSVVGVGAVGCGSPEKDSTTQSRVTLQTRVLVPSEVRQSFTNSYGWSIHLEKAALAMGPLYYFEGEPVLVYRSPGHPKSKGLWASIYDWFVPDASAHPGHYQAGLALGQMLEAANVDLLRTPAAIPNGDGVTGTYRSASFFFAKPVDDELGKFLDGATCRVVGTATKDSVTIHFRVGVQQEELLNYENKPSVIGCAFDPYGEVGSDATVQVTIDPRLWFDQVDFGALPTRGDGSTVEFAPGTIARKAFVRGMKKGGGYRFSVPAQNQ